MLSAKQAPVAGIEDSPKSAAAPDILEGKASMLFGRTQTMVRR